MRKPAGSDGSSQPGGAGSRTRSHDITWRGAAGGRRQRRSRRKGASRGDSPARELRHHDARPPARLEALGKGEQIRHAVLGLDLPEAGDLAAGAVEEYAVGRAVGRRPGAAPAGYAVAAASAARPASVASASSRRRDRAVAAVEHGDVLVQLPAGVHGRAERVELERELVGVGVGGSSPRSIAARA